MGTNPQQAHWNAIENMGKLTGDSPVESRNLIYSFSKHLKAIDNFALPKVAIFTRFELHHNSKNISTYKELINLEQNCSALYNLRPTAKAAKQTKI